MPTTIATPARTGPRLRLVIVRIAAGLTLLLVAAGCGSSGKTSAGDASSASSAAPALTGSITVSAAASLNAAFSTIREQFLAAHPGIDVTINFGSSTQLETQIESGAPAAVAAFADQATMAKLADKSLLDGPSQIFAVNQLTIVTKPGNPKAITSLSGLATAGIVSLCAETAPCGRYAGQILTAAGVTIPESSVTRGQDVKTTLAAVTEGDADAGIVYVTDAQAAGSTVTTVEIAAEQNAVVRYPIGVLKATTNSPLAQAFMAYVLGPEGQAVLKDAGFGPP
jgi:molybdate transport system substrate-binding protein